MKIKALIGAMALLAVTSQAQGSAFFDSLVPGLNTLEDANREVIFDMDNDGVFSAGDALVGFLQLDNNLTSGTDLGDDTWAIFAQEVISDTVSPVGATNVFHDIVLGGIGSTAATAPIVAKLNAITGGGWGGGSKVAELYGDVGVNYLTTSPGDADPDAQLNIFDFLAAISANTLDLEVGFLEPGSDFWAASGIAPIGADPLADLTLLEGIAQSAGGAFPNFEAGLSIITPVAGFNDELTLLAAPGEVYELTVTGGGLSGASDRCYGTVNPFFSGATSDVSAGGIATCGPANGNITSVAGLGTINYYGFTSNADFNVNAVSEPFTLGIMGAGLMIFGMAGASRRGRKQAS